MSAFVHDQIYRALKIVDRMSDGCIGVIVTREDFDPHLRHAEVAVVDTTDREAQAGELYAIELHQHRHGRATASLAIIQAYHRDGALWCRYGFKALGLVPLCDGPFTADGWRQKCTGRIVAAMRPTWQAAGHAR